MTFFFDNMISPRLAKALDVLDQDRDVKALRDEFADDTPDESWLREIGRRGWVLITADRHIRTRPHELRAFREATVTTFFLGRFFTRSLTFWAQAAWLVKYWPRLVTMAEAVTKGTCFIAGHTGKLTSV